MKQKISSRDRAMPEMIRDRVSFETYGALSAGGRSGSGVLNNREADIFHAQKPSYVVYSYATPIAWWSEEHGWYVVSQKFSVTTSKHQGKLYLIGSES